MGIWQRWRPAGRVVGLEWRGDSLAAVACHEADGVTQVKDLSVLKFGDAGELAGWAKSQQLKGARCRAVLGVDHYQLLLVEPPDVPAPELRNALRWRLKDMLQMPVEEAVIDYFPLPENGTRGKQKMVYVAAAEKRHIIALAEAARRAEMKLISVDINELAVRNLARRLMCDTGAERGVAVVRLRAGGASVYFYRGGDLYFARNLSLHYGGGLFDEVPGENLALELQRSMDYYERQMGQVPPAVIYVCGEQVFEDKINQDLRGNLAVQVQYLDPGALASLPEAAGAELGQSCLVALGVALSPAQGA